MKIAVISGSPKGKNSITLQSVRYLAAKYKEDQFDILHVVQQIKQFEKTEKLEEAMDRMRQADLILWVYPVYTFLAPYQLHRFMELVKNHPMAGELSGKWSSQLSTSKHFYDYTAHGYIEENSVDLGLKVIKGLSADMDDLLSRKGQKELCAFWDLVHFKTNLQLDVEAPHREGLSHQKRPLDTVILTSARPEDTQLLEMIYHFQSVYPHSCRVINLNTLRIDGGCLGCFNCASTGKCIYKDNFDHFLREEIQKADAIVYAGVITDHSMGALFKRYDDRQFCNGHRTVNMGMPIGYLLQGAYSKEPNLKLTIEGRADVGHMFLAGVVASENDENALIQSKITELAQTMDYALKSKVLLPQSFLGVGGMKIFRDLIFLMRGLMKEDHRFYKEKGFYDFPHKKVGTLLKMQLIGSLMEMPSVKKKMKSKMNDAIVKPYEKVITQALESRVSKGRKHK